ncbi:MAG: hypothetical protein ABI068_08565 [Ktedonobacterales bacterium]
MIERLHATIDDLERFPPDIQEEAAAELERFISRKSPGQAAAPDERDVLDLIGAWSDIPFCHEDCSY